MWAAIVILIIVVIAAYFMVKSMKTTAQAQESKAPTVQEGRKIRRVYGTVWLDDPAIIGWKPMGTIPIKAQGKK